MVALIRDVELGGISSQINLLNDSRVANGEIRDYDLLEIDGCSGTCVGVDLMVCRDGIDPLVIESGNSDGDDVENDCEMRWWCRLILVAMVETCGGGFDVDGGSIGNRWTFYNYRNIYVTHIMLFVTRVEKMQHM